jgi:hypothetical protein
MYIFNIGGKKIRIDKLSVTDGNLIVHFLPVPEGS